MKINDHIRRSRSDQLFSISWCWCIILNDLSIHRFTLAIDRSSVHNLSDAQSVNKLNLNWSRISLAKHQRTKRILMICFNYAYCFRQLPLIMHSCDKFQIHFRLFKKLSKLTYYHHSWYYCWILHFCFMLHCCSSWTTDKKSKIYYKFGHTEIG